MRVIGLDLAITSAHKVIVMDEGGRFLTPVFQVMTWPEELAAMLRRAREGAADDIPLVVVMEPTGLAWLPVAIYLLLHGVAVYLVNSQQVADLRKFYKKHAKSDRIDARVLAKLYLIAQEKLHALRLPSADLYALQRACKQLDWVTTEITKLSNQMSSLDQVVWLGGWTLLTFLTHLAQLPVGVESTTTTPPPSSRPDESVSVRNGWLAVWLKEKMIPNGSQIWCNWPKR